MGDRLLRVSDDRVLRVIEQLRLGRPYCEPVRVAHSRDPLEPRFFSSLVENWSFEEMPYVEFLCQIHRHIQNKFN